MFKIKKYIKNKYGHNLKYKNCHYSRQNVYNFITNKYNQDQIKNYNYVCVTCNVYLRIQLNLNKSKKSKKHKIKYLIYKSISRYKNVNNLTCNEMIIKNLLE